MWTEVSILEEPEESYRIPTQEFADPESMSKLNLKTVKAHHIRENFQEIYKEATKERFEKSLKKWYFWATHSRIYEMIDAARTVKHH